MADEYAEAISFANSYFALVDGLAFGIENHLAKDVVLDWFGRTIRGRTNVATFMQTHKVSSRHIFSSITPTSCIAYKKKDANRKSLYSYENETAPLEGGDAVRTKDFQFGKDENENEIEPKQISTAEDTMYDLSEGDLSNLFKLEITPTSVEMIERSINRIKLEEEMAPTIKAIKRECGQGDGPAETSTVKYVEANGEIEFSRKFWKQDSWDAYSSVASSVHTWRRFCNLQIAYSAFDVPQPSKRSRRGNKKPVSRFGHPFGRLPSLDELNELSGRLVPNTDDFGKLFKPVDLFSDRNEILEAVESEMASENSGLTLFSPRYVKNKLVFDKPSVEPVDNDIENRKRFLFNYQIHLIIYEGTNKCRMNLLREFEKLNV